MNWSMTSVSFRMAGAGNWQILLPDEESRQLYAHIYPGGALLQDSDNRSKKMLTSWQDAGIATVVAQRLVPLGPIMTDQDLKTLAPWFQNISRHMCQVISKYLTDYRLLVQDMCGGSNAPKNKVDNLLIILTCAEALDVWTFRMLRQALIGPHPPRGPAGRFFFWGYAFSGGPKRIFGVSNYAFGKTGQLSVIRSRGLGRTKMLNLLRQELVVTYLERLLMPESTASTLYPGSHRTERIIQSLRDVGLLEPNESPRLAIPILNENGMEKVAWLHNKVSREVISHFTTTTGMVRGLISQCSFAECSLPDVLCMIFHLAYSYAADALIAEGAIPDFPEQAGGEWGVWFQLIK